MPDAGSSAGAYDSQFGFSTTRTVPIDFFVTLTSVYSATTGYSWSELRGSPGAGFAAPGLPRTGDQAYEVSGRTDLAVGTTCRMFLDRDQTVYGLVPVGGAITVEEADGTPSYAGVSTLQFDQADGFVVSQPGAGIARVDYDPSKATDCKGCDWLAGMGLTRCLRVTVNAVATDLYLSTTDGLTWTSADLLTICGVDYTVTARRNAGGVPQLTLTAPGSGGAVYTGQWNCCGCAYAKWGFNLQTICPGEADTGDPCTNVVEVRVDAVNCAGGPSCLTAPAVAPGEPMQNHSTGVVGQYETGSLSWSITVAAGTTYRVRFRRHGPAGGGIAAISGTVYNPSCAVETTSELEFASGATVLNTDTDYCWDFAPTINGCLCITMTNGNIFNQNTATVTVGACP